jgi:putative polymerase
LADSRLGLVLCFMALIVWSFSALRDQRVLFFLPAFVVLALITVSHVIEMRVYDNSIVGRLYSSSRLLSSFGADEWFGLVKPNRFTGDSGYAYLFQRIGIVGVAGLWVMFLLVRIRTPEAAAFRAGLAFYICMSLSVSESVFSIKTAALAWFILGTLNGVGQNSIVRLESSLKPRACRAQLADRTMRPQ